MIGWNWNGSSRSFAHSLSQELPGRAFPNPGLHLQVMSLPPPEIWQTSFLPHLLWHLVCGSVSSAVGALPRMLSTMAPSMLLPITSFLFTSPSSSISSCLFLRIPSDFFTNGPFGLSLVKSARKGGPAPTIRFDSVVVGVVLSGLGV